MPSKTLKNKKINNSVELYLKKNKHNSEKFNSTKLTKFKKTIKHLESGTNSKKGVNPSEYKNVIDDFSFVTNVEKLDADSSNGTLFKIEYTIPIKNPIYLYSILKLSKSSDNDNIVYEYLLGLEINKYTSKYPCFIYTFGLYTFQKKFLLQMIKAFIFRENMSMEKYISILNIKNKLLKRMKLDFNISKSKKKK